MKTILLTVVSLLLFGCVMPPKKIQGFKTGNYDINIKKVVKRRKSHRVWTLLKKLVEIWF